MPALSLLYRLATTAADSRILESRQAGALARKTVQSLSPAARDITNEAPTLLRRNVDEFWCQRGIIAACYQGLNAGPAPPAIVGIVLGSIAGFLLLMWLLFVLSSGGGFIRTTELREEDEVVVARRRSRSPRSRRSHRSSVHVHGEMRRSSPRRDRVIRQERIVRDVPPPRRDTSRSRVRESIIVEESSRPERRVDGDDIVEVIEEHSSGDGAPAPRRKNRRGSGYNR